MHITAEHGDQHVTLHLRGEFDTFYCADLEKEVAAIQKAGIPNVVLNLRWVKFINSTALGAIIKASKALTIKKIAKTNSQISAVLVEPFQQAPPIIPLIEPEPEPSPHPITRHCRRASGYGSG